MVTAITYAGDTHPGRMRPNNEDAYYVTALNGSADQAAIQRGGYLFIVADGVGGNRGGARASEIAVSRLPAYYYAAANGDPGRNLAGAIGGVSREIVAEAAANPERANMRCTVVAAVVKDATATIAHLGDSRAYLWRDGALRVLTRDHTWVQMQVEKGTLTEAEAQNHLNRNMITKSMGDPALPEPDVTQIALQDGDRLLLCSDGLGGVVPHAEIAAVLGRAPDPATAKKELIDLANRHDGPDNVTAVVVQAGRAVIAAPPPRKSSAPLLLMLVVAAALLIGSFVIFRPTNGRSAIRPPAAEPAPGNENGAAGPVAGIVVTIPPEAGGEPTSTPAGVVGQEVITATGTLTPTQVTQVVAAAQATAPAATVTPTPPPRATLSGPGGVCSGGYLPFTPGDTIVFKWGYTGDSSSLRVRYRYEGAEGQGLSNVAPTRESGNTWVISVQINPLFSRPGNYDWQVVGPGVASDWYCFRIAASEQNTPVPPATDTSPTTPSPTPETPPPTPTDIDGDDTPNDEDECPNDNAGFNPDPNRPGCPLPTPTPATTP